MSALHYLQQDVNHEVDKTNLGLMTDKLQNLHKKLLTIQSMFIKESTENRPLKTTKLLNLKTF